jgi:hypothetical protein
LRISGRIRFLDQAWIDQLLMLVAILIYRPTFAILAVEAVFLIWQNRMTLWALPCDNFW